MRKYGKIYKERLGTMDMVHIFEPSDIATMFRLEGKYPSRGLIANLELTYLQRNNKLVGFAFLLVIIFVNDASETILWQIASV